MLVIYKTKQYIDNLRKDSSNKITVERKLDELKNRQWLGSSKNPKCYDKGRGIWIYKLRGLGQNSRVILQEYKLDAEQKHSLIIVRDYISKSQYEPTWRIRVQPIIEQGKYFDYFPLSSDEEEEALQLYLDTVNPADKPKSDLPPHLSNWVETFSLDYEFSIYESRNWPKYQHGIEKYFGELYNLLAEVVNSKNETGNKHDLSSFRNIRTITDGAIILVFECVYNADIKHNVFLLHGWCPKEKNEILTTILDESLNYSSLKNIDITKYSTSKLIDGAFRGYPASIFNQQDGRNAWDKIQNNSNKSNLALSPEQVVFLKNIKFPVFINGQAGSGKSEMLMYLLAELIFLKEADEYSGNPVFLTENEELLDRSIYDVIEKLQFNYRYTTYNITLENTKKYFNTFQNLLRDSFFDEEDEIYARIRKDGKYIHFHRFKQLYLESQLPQNIKKKYPAEISWFVINTFIRGYSIEQEEFSLEDFKALYKKDKISYITDEIFTDIYKYIWLGFYKKLLEEEEYWDRLFIIRKIIEKYVTIPENKKFTIILCDEAQDFTRLELQFLLKLSTYSAYDVTNLMQVPITFAGDPFQTVNPTGFNLSQVKRLFSNELETTYGLTDNIDIVYSLVNNYRSTPEIVDFANVIQYIRFKYLKNTELDKGQEAKRFSSGQKPKLIPLDKSDKNELLNKLRYEIFIGPCNNGEEEDYVDRDEYVNREYILKSAARSKGNEYEKVVLYRFGDHFIEQFGQEFIRKLLDNTININELDAGLQFRLSFYFNKLYVASTRAMDELIILDTSAGIEYFWDILISHKSLNIVHDRNWTTVDSRNIIDNATPDILGEADFTTALRNALNEIEQGELYQDSDKMKTAIHWLQKINDDGKYSNKIKLCEAKRLQFDQQYKKAGDIFSGCYNGELSKSINAKDEASNCYWVGGNWRELLTLHGNEDKVSWNIRNFVARIMLEDNYDLQDIIRYRDRIQISIMGEGLTMGRAEWQEEFYKQLITVVKRKIPELSGRWMDIADAIDSFQNKTIQLCQLIGSLYFKAQNYKRTFDVYFEIEDTENPEFLNSGVQISTDINKKIFYLKQLKREFEILDLYKMDFEIFDVESSKIVEDILYRSSQFNDLNTIHKKHPDLLSDLISYALKDNNQKRAKFLFESYVYEALNNNAAILDNTFLNKTIDHTISLMQKMLGQRDSQLLFQSAMNNAADTALRRRISKLLFGEDSYFESVLLLIKCVGYISTYTKNTHSGLDNLILNFLYGIPYDKAEVIDNLELSTCLDKLMPKHSLLQNLYVDIKGTLLQNGNLDIAEREVLEERFWKICFTLNLKNGLTEEQIIIQLNEIYNKYSTKLGFKDRNKFADILWLKELPEFTAPINLRKVIEDKRQRSEDGKKKKDEFVKDISSEIHSTTDDSEGKVRSLEEEIKKLQKQLEKEKLKKGI